MFRSGAVLGCVIPLSRDVREPLLLFYHTLATSRGDFVAGV